MPVRVDEVEIRVAVRVDVDPGGVAGHEGVGQRRRREPVKSPPPSLRKRRFPCRGAPRDQHVEIAVAVEVGPVRLAEVAVHVRAADAPWSVNDPLPSLRKSRFVARQFSDVEVGQAVVVVVDPGRRHPRWRGRPGAPRWRRRRRSAGSVVEQLVRAVGGADEEIGAAVAVVVAPGHGAAVRRAQEPSWSRPATSDRGGSGHRIRRRRVCTHRRRR